MSNIDKATVFSFGDEWERFDQRKLSGSDLDFYFNKYFSIFPWDLINSGSEGFDMGCGSGRWAKKMALKVKTLNCIDPSEAIKVAKRNLKIYKNVIFHKGSVDNNKIKNSSQDFGYSLGVLHHIPDTQKAINSCVKLLKPGAPFLVYLYYSFENRHIFYKLLWKISDIIRLFMFRTNPNVRQFVSDIFAIIVYFPLARISLLLEKLKINVNNIPLSFYKRASLYTMRTDARDRFGTPLEQRFSKKQITKMLQKSGLESIKFSDTAPFWCAVGIKKKDID